MHSVGGVGEELEPGLNHESWGGVGCYHIQECLSLGCGA